MNVEPKTVARKFDWESAKAQIERARIALDSAESLSPQQELQLLQRRAMELALEPPAVPADSEVMEVVGFQLGDEYFAIATDFVLELTHPDSITPVPDCRDELVGIVNLRGTVTSVWDIRKLLGLKRSRQGDAQPSVLVLGKERTEFAMIIDNVETISTIRIDEILEPMGGTRSGRELIFGSLRDGRLLLNGDALFGCVELYIDETG